MKKEVGQKKKVSSPLKKIIIKAPTHAFFIDDNGVSKKKGSFKKGRILIIDKSDKKEVKGQKLYRVKNISHDNIYIACSTQNCQVIKRSQLLSLAKSYLKCKELNKDLNVKLTIPEAASLIERKINLTLRDSYNPVNGLCYYDDDAFDNCDGFGYAKKSEPIEIVKGGVEEFYEVKEAPKPKKRGSVSYRGNGEGIGFNQ